MKTYARFFLLSTFVFLFFPFGQIHGEEAAPVKAGFISENTAIAPGIEFWTAVVLEPESGWHTYWKNPGDSGLATKISLDLPAGFSAGPVLWPFPEVIPIPPLVTYGYESRHLFLIPINAPDTLNPGLQAKLKVRVEWLACKVDCIPGRQDLTLDLPVARRPVVDYEKAAQFAEARLKIPLRISDWNITAKADAKQIHLRIIPPEGASIDRQFYFFPERSDLMDHAALESTRAVSGGWELQLKRSPLFAGNLQSLEGVLVSNKPLRGPNSERALEIRIPAGRLTGGEPDSMNLWIASLFAFLGGLILNLMPCVLPVLSLKILGLAGQTESRPKERLWHGLWYSAGILVAFWSLFGFLMALRMSGSQIGWGFQLQSPFFLAFLTIVFLFFALNLFGVYEIGLSLTRLGSAGIKNRDSHIQSFLSGVLAVIVATPCTAPFMGAALGFALFQPPLTGFLIFSFLAAGLAFPYLLLCLNPSWTACLPRPGIWMESLKKAIGFALLAVVLWFIQLLASNLGIEKLGEVFTGLWLVSTGLWFFGENQRRPGKFFKKILCLFLILAGTGILYFSAKPANFFKQREQTKIVWEDFSQDRLRELMRGHEPFFLDFTADWCLTCKVNERVALENEKVAQAFHEIGIIAVKADWTRRDPAITEALAKYGRSSIPFYVYYPAGPKDHPRILPEILTPQTVLETIRKDQSNEGDKQ